VYWFHYRSPCFILFGGQTLNGLRRGAWREGGLDSVWEQKKLEARKMLENVAESHTSGARFVGRTLTETDLKILSYYSLNDEYQ